MSGGNYNQPAGYPQQGGQPQQPYGQQQAGYAAVKPHRGVLVLVFGILSIPVCFIFGIVAMILGKADMKEMQAGTMDRTGEGMTKAGFWLGLAGIILWALIIAFYVLVFMVLVSSGAVIEGTNY
jgi:hypothetical protein